MPNRVLRDWTTSETIDKLSQGAEVFFTRLIMKADDFGNYTANLKLLKAALFPLKNYHESEIQLWLDECCSVGILKMYSSDHKDFINIPNFGQRLRAMKSQYPDISQSNGSQLSVNGRPETKRNEDEKNKKGIEGVNIHALASDINTFLKRTNPNTMDVVYMVQQWVEEGHTDILNQVKAMKAHYDLNNLTFPTKIETLTQSFSEADWIEKLKESDPDRKAERISKTIKDASRRTPEPDTIGTSPAGSLG